MNEINIKSTTIEAGIEAVKDFLTKVIGPSANELGEMAGDNFRLRRFRNQLKNFVRAKQICEEQNVNIKHINLKVLFPYLEGVALEEDPALQEMWSNLFVNHIDKAKSLTLTVYPDILGQISTNEATILSTMSRSENYSIAVGMFKTVEHEVGYEEVANLVRLGLVVPLMPITYSNDPAWHRGRRPMERDYENDTYFLTQFGHQFIAACQR